MTAARKARASGPEISPATAAGMTPGGDARPILVVGPRATAILAARELRGASGRKSAVTRGA